MPLRLAVGNDERVRVRAGTDAVLVKLPVSAPPSVNVIPVTEPTPAPEISETGIMPALPVTVPADKDHVPPFRMRFPSVVVVSVAD